MIVRIDFPHSIAASFQQVRMSNLSIPASMYTTSCFVPEGRSKASFMTPTMGFLGRFCLSHIDGVVCTHILAKKCFNIGFVQCDCATLRRSPICSMQHFEGVGSSKYGLF